MIDHEHWTKWGVLSEDGHIYGVDPNTQEAAERECRILRTPDASGYSEPRAKVTEKRLCDWVGTFFHEPRDQ